MRRRPNQSPFPAPGSGYPPCDRFRHGPTAQDSSVRIAVQDGVALRRPVDRRVDKSTLSVATFNAEWLFVQNYKKRWSSEQEARDHLKGIAGVLKKLNADVVNLAEVEDCGVLRILIEEIGGKASGYVPYLIRGTDTSTGQNVALITRVDPFVNMQRTEAREKFPVSDTHCNCNESSCGFGTSGVSKHYWTAIEAENFGAS